MRANNGDHLHRYAGSSGGGGRGGREGEAYIVGGVGSGSDSSPWISCSAVRTISNIPLCGRAKARLSRSGPKQTLR